MSTTPIPIAMVAGFLGSGKTTLMRRLIQDAGRRGVRLSVIVNEFGAADVDSNILREGDAELIASISGGCACCSGQDDFNDALLEIAGRDAEKRPDLILVETSGLADPVLLLDVITGPQLLTRLKETAIFTVIDSGRWLEMLAALGPLLRRQVQLADAVVLNKTDLVDAARIEAVAAKVAELNPRAQVLPTAHCAVDLDVAWQHLLEGAGRSADERPDEAAPHAHYHTVVCPMPHPVAKDRLVAALNSLPPDVWRAKGFVRVRGEEGLQLVQYTGGGSGPGRHMIAPFYMPPFGVEPGTFIVFIGAALNKDELLEEFLGRDRMLTVL